MRGFKAPSQKFSLLWLLCYKWIPLGCHSPITTTQEQVMTLLTQREGMDAFSLTSCLCQWLNQSGVQESQRVMKWEIMVILKHAHKFLNNPPFEEWSRVPLSLTTVFSRLFPMNRTKLRLQSLQLPSCSLSELTYLSRSHTERTLKQPLLRSPQAQKN